MKKINIGIENFKELIESECYYVDKTNVIEKLLDDRSKVVLFPRPRRFGKSLLMSTLYNFFEVTLKEDNKNLFKGLNISKSKYYSELSNYPTIYLSFKSLKLNTYNACYEELKTCVSFLFEEKQYIYDSLNEDEKEIFERLKTKKGEETEYRNFLLYLSKWLERYHNKKVIILIDEYDAALNEGYINNYYKDISNLIRGVLSSALKGNESLKIGVLTGVLRIGGLSLFSDVNNIDIYDVMSTHYNEFFGFTKEDTEELLKYYGIEKTKEVDEYYDGYNFSGLHIYNPWSILKYAKEKKLEPYWIATGSNIILKRLLSKCTDSNTTSNIEKLFNGESINFNYDNSISYESFTDTNSINNLYNLLLVSGYLTLDREETSVTGRIKQYFKIPNKEVKEDLMKIFREINFESGYELTLNNLEDAIYNDDKERFKELLNEMLSCTSYMDTNEKFYHGFLVGILTIFLSNNYYRVKSNRESGSGRYDIMISDREKTWGTIIEIKIADSEEKMDKLALEALKQIDSREYIEELKNEGIKDIRKYGVVFYKKKAIVK